MGRDESDSDGDGNDVMAGNENRDTDEDEGEEYDEECLEFDPYAFIKALPPLEACVPRPRRCLLPRQTRRCKRKTLVRASCLWKLGQEWLLQRVAGS